MGLVRWANRKRLLVDGRVQGALVLRVVFYWFMCQFTVTIMLLVWTMLSTPPRLFTAHLADLLRNVGPALIASTLLLPLVTIDVLRVSNRFAGPLWRLRGAMRKLARGQKVEPLRFRGDDFWRDVAEEFNAVAARFDREDDLHAPGEHADHPFTRVPVAADIDH